MDELVVLVTELDQVGRAINICKDWGFTSKVLGIVQRRIKAALDEEIERLTKEHLSEGYD